MIMRSLQPCFTKHLMGFPHTEFGSLVQALYGIEEGISRGLCADSSPSDSNGKKPGLGPRPSDVGAIGMTRHRSPPHLPFQRQFLDTLTRLYDKISTDQLLLSGRLGLLFYIRHHNQYMLHRRLRGHMYSTNSSIEHCLHRGQPGSLHNSGCH